MKEQLIKASARIVLAVVVAIFGLVFVLWPKKATVVRNLLTRDRRSVVKYSGAATSAAVNLALEAAIHAPNHFLNEPWRFRLLGKVRVVVSVFVRAPLALASPRSIPCLVLESTPLPSLTSGDDQ